MTATHWGLVRPVYDDVGRLASLQPHEVDFSPSPVLGELALLAASPARIARPAVREGFLTGKHRDGKWRGRERFIEVPWDEALDLVALELDRVYRDYGPAAVFGRSYGWKSSGLVNSSITLLQRLLNLCGGFLRCANSYSTAAIATILPYVVGERDPRSEAWESVLANAERIVFWGCDPLITNDIDWTTTLHNARPYFERLKASGIPTISVNPIRTKTAKWLESAWLAPRPGTDPALMLALMHAALEVGIDEDIIQRMTDGWDVFKSYILGAEDGVAKTPQWGESVTGIPAATIRNLAHDWLTHRTKIILGWGTQRRPFGEQMPWMGMALAAVFGQIGLPGGGISVNAHYSQGGCLPGKGPKIRGITERVAPVRAFKDTGSVPTIPVARFSDCFLNPGKTIQHNGHEVMYPDVRMAIWAGGNPFAHQPQTARLIKAWTKPEAAVVVDSVWTTTARFADIVLPAQTVFEHDDITGIGTYTNDGVCAMHHLIDPVGEAKSDYEIFSALASRLGVEDAFTEGRTESDWIRAIYEEARGDGEKTGTSLPTFDEFWKKGLVLYERNNDAKTFVPWEKFRKDPAANRLKTESGRIQLYSPLIASFGYEDCPGMPSFLPEKEAKPEDALYYLSPKSSQRLHSQLDGVVRKPGSQGRELCVINTADASRRGIREGEAVLLENSRGAAIFSALVTDDIMPGAVAVAHGAWCEPKMIGGRLIDNHGCANMLSVDEPTSSLSGGNIASGGWVRAAKWQGEDIPVANRRPPDIVSLEKKTGEPDCAGGNSRP